jgi:hypothetical protein
MEGIFKQKLYRLSHIHQIMKQSFADKSLFGKYINLYMNLKKSRGYIGYIRTEIMHKNFVKFVQYSSDEKFGQLRSPHWKVAGSCPDEVDFF